MPRTKSSVAEDEEKAPGVVKPPEYLEDGHPNPDAWEVWDFMQEVAEKGLWDHYIGYLYRVDPKHAPGDRGSGYVTVIASPLTMEEVRHKYGGKKWTLLLNRRFGSRQKLIYKSQFDIEAPAKWQDNETPLEPAARSGGASGLSSAGLPQDVMGLFEKMLADVLTQRDKAAEEGRAFNPSEALNNALDLQRKGFESVMAAKGGDGQLLAWMPMILKVLEIVTAKKDDALTLKLIEIVTARHEEKSAGMTEQLAFMRELMGFAKEMKGGGGGSDWAGLGSTLVEKLPDIMDRGAILAGNLAAARTANPGGASRSPGTPFAMPKSIPAAAPAAATEPLPPTLTEQQAELAVLLRVKQLIVDILFRGEDGSVAAELADRFHPPFAAQLAEDLKASAADPSKLEPIKADAILGKAFTHPNVLKFSQRYVAYFEEETPDGAAA